MPIPRLQYIGREEDRFLYEYSWGKDVKRSEVAAYQRRAGGATFDNLLRLKPGVVEAIRSVSGILRPLVHREWAMMVAAMNGLSEAKLEGFLFGVNRVQLDAVRAPLRKPPGGEHANPARLCAIVIARLLVADVAPSALPWPIVARPATAGPVLVA